MRRLIGVGLAGLVLSVGAWGFLLVPAAVASPFQVHDTELIGRLYLFRSWGTAVAALATATMIALTAWLWRSERRTILRAASLMPVLILAAAIWFSGQQVAEWAMFAPIDTVAFVAADRATHVADDDMVLSVRVGDETRAYPVLMTAYYHIVHDEIAGEPYVVTY